MDKRKRVALETKSGAANDNKKAKRTNLSKYQLLCINGTIEAAVEDYIFFCIQKYEYGKDKENLDWFKTLMDEEIITLNEEINRWNINEIKYCKSCHRQKKALIRVHKILYEE